MVKKTDLIHPSIWTNVFLLAPLLVAGVFGLWWVMVLLILLFVVSTIYHFLLFHKKTKYLKVFMVADIFFASTLMFTDLSLVLSSREYNPFFLAALITLIISLAVYQKQAADEYELYHGAWHFLAALGTLFSQFAFIFFAL